MHIFYVYYSRVISKKVKIKLKIEFVFYEMFTTVGLLDKPSKHQKAEALHSFANNCSTVVNSLTSSLQNQPPNPFCIEKVLHDIIEFVYV